MAHAPVSTTQISEKTNNQRFQPRTVEDLTRHNIETVATLEEAANSQRTRGDVIADTIAGFCGSMTFFWVHVVWFTLWIGANTLLPIHHFDTYPFQFLTLVVSLEAIFLSTFIMISQNRQERLNSRRNHLDLQINLLSEQENSKMLSMLEAIMQRMDIQEGDPEVHVLTQATSPEKLMEQIEETIERQVAQAETGK